jgi:predicted GNAT family N-acyltransferase
MTEAVPAGRYGRAAMEVRPARDSHEVDQALRLRERVFCGEQGVTPAAERDGRDGAALHLVAVDEGVVVGTCRLTFSGRVGSLGRLAVDRGHRRRGIGAELVAESERAARVEGARRIALHAEVGARGIYDAAGYVQLGEPFVEEGIDHVTMEKQLA